MCVLQGSGCPNGRSVPQEDYTFYSRHKWDKGEDPGVVGVPCLLAVDSSAGFIVLLLPGRARGKGSGKMPSPNCSGGMKLVVRTVRIPFD